MEIRDGFSKLHPAVTFTYFVAVILFALLLLNPVFQGIGLFSSILCFLIYKGKKALSSALVFILPLFILAIVLNPLFNHRGVTVIAYLPSGNPVTLESLIYGVSAGVMIITVLFWFMIYNQVITTDKFIYLFGKRIPALSLVLSMALSFGPRFKDQFIKIREAQVMLGRDGKSLKTLSVILKIMVTWALENGIDTADSMRSRGYGTGTRSNYSIYIFDRRNLIILVFLTGGSVFLVLGSVFGIVGFQYYPVMSEISLGGKHLVLYTLYLLLCITPLMVRLREDYQWKYSNQRS